MPSAKVKCPRCSSAVEISIAIHSAVVGTHICTRCGALLTSTLIVSLDTTDTRLISGEPNHKLWTSMNNGRHIQLSRQLETAQTIYAAICIGIYECTLHVHTTGWGKERALYSNFFTVVADAKVKALHVENALKDLEARRIDLTPDNVRDALDN